MSSQKRPEQFPEQYHSFAEEVGEQGVEVTLPLGNMKDCFKFRGHFYLYKGVVRKTAEAALARGNPTETELYWIKIARWLDKVSVWIDPATASLKLINRDRGVYGRMAATAVRESNPLPPTLTGRRLEESLLKNMGLDPVTAKPSEADAMGSEFLERMKAGGIAPTQPTNLLEKPKSSAEINRDEMAAYLRQKDVPRVSEKDLGKK